jgi:putative transposase
VDNYSKICHALLVGKSLKGADQGSMRQWKRVPFKGSRYVGLPEQGHAGLFQTRKPTDNPYVESFNGKFRDECLSVNWVLSLDDAREKTENYPPEYHHFRPHSSLDDLTPKEFINLQYQRPETLF